MHEFIHDRMQLPCRRAAQMNIMLGYVAAVLRRRAVHHEMIRRGDIRFWMSDSSPIGSRNMLVFTGTSTNGEMMAEAVAAARFFKEMGCRPLDEFSLEDLDAMQSMLRSIY